ncbi:MAG: ATP-binding cassette domain-containing protein [Myxococcota bacterium]
MTAPLVELRDLTIVAPDRPLVNGVSLDVMPGEVTALIGPSGSGKSLTARAVMCVLDVDPGLVRGTLRFPALDPNKDWYEQVRGGGMRRQRQLLGWTRHLRGSYFTYSPQSASSALNPGRTIGRQLELAIRRRDVPPSGAQMSEEIDAVLHEVGLRASVSSALPSELSGGMCQRAALAIAVAPQPQLVIADEPETGLDPVLRRSVVELLVRVCREHGAGLMIISHNHDTVERIADRVISLPGPEGADSGGHP